MSGWPPPSEDALVALALGLGARTVEGWSEAEHGLAAHAGKAPARLVATARRAIQRGLDPLGEALCQLRTPEQRRPMGATYTPEALVASMVQWAHGQFPAPTRIVDPGCGSGRFLVAAGKRFPSARLLAIEIDPLAVLLARAHFAASGLASRVEVLIRDYREVRLPPIKGTTLFLGNPPYVRHHLLGQKWKHWLTASASALGLKASQLAGLHVHFFLATAQNARPGDVGVLVTAAEWLDVNYGHVLRQLLLGYLGAQGLHVIEPTALPFSDAQTTAVITCFQVGTKPRALSVRRVAKLEELGSLDTGRSIPRERLEAATRWTPLTRPARQAPKGYVELGELCRVHRGQVTGANPIWIVPPDDSALPASVLFPSVTRARELFDVGPVLSDTSRLRRVIDLPVDLDTLPPEDRKCVDRFLKKAKALGADQGFIARHRKAWWSVGLREPAPILATYMARRPPAFVLNPAQARHINIAHGLYPREPLSPPALKALAEHLSHAVSLSEGRMYAGGLTKFEPREMERLLVPEPRAPV